METVFQIPGNDFSKNSYHRRAIHLAKRRIMRFILKKENQGYFVSCGFLLKQSNIIKYPDRSGIKDIEDL